MAELKTKPTTQAVREFLAGIPDDKRRVDCFGLVDLMQEATGCEPVMWGESIVGFGKYKYDYEIGRTGEWMVIGFSPRKSDLSVYIMPGFEKYQTLMKKLGKHKTGKSCLYLKALADIDIQVLKQLVAASVKAMAEKRVE